MNDNACDDATDGPVSLNNETTAYADVFYGAALSRTASASSGIGTRAA